jgi:oligopeptide/dipeptide ABC transporter ATP-binding protein
MIAAALMGSPRLLLADEPTTALDVTTQAEVMVILDELRRERGLAMIFITHDLELAAAVCDRTAVMYAGQIVELNESRQIERDPLHPYTAALLRSRPRIDMTQGRLAAIPGQPLSSFAAPESACAFEVRCPFATAACRSAPPPLVTVASGESRCIRVDELRAGRQLVGSDDGSGRG